MAVELVRRVFGTLICIVLCLRRMREMNSLDLPDSSRYQQTIATRYHLKIH